METLITLCKPRDIIFKSTLLKDDTLEITDLINNKINPQEFFEENFITDGMKLLIKNAFDRFHGNSNHAIAKLTQSMGGGKTHNMIALGLLAKYPSIRSKVFTNEELSKYYLNEIKVVAFTGRESDYPIGLWGAIAEQLGKKEFLKDYYSPLKAPGRSKWIELLKGQPLLILLDELPPYLENAKSQSIGNSDLATVTQTALSNLFNALNSEELKNVFLVISDLSATYEFGSKILQSSFKNLEGEINRIAIPIDPVQYNTDEIFQILKKRLFKFTPDLNSNEINEIALGYLNAIKSTKQMGLTNISEDKIYSRIKESYPFHPVIKDLYELFKENTGFQQTRGLIRLMRHVVKQLYSGDKPLASQKYLIHPYDYDLNDQYMSDLIININPSLKNAISHDIAHKGNSVAEIYDKNNKPLAQEICKLILMASLSNIPDSVIGLNENEIIGYLCEPNKDIRKYKEALNYITSHAWYLHIRPNDKKIYFKQYKNINAQINSIMDSYNINQIESELAKYLTEQFEPKIKDCYQQLLVFPDKFNEIKLSSSIDDITLIITKPTTANELTINNLDPELISFYKNNNYKNRVMFLTGIILKENNIYELTKQFKAINHILSQSDMELSDEDKKILTNRLEKIKSELKTTTNLTFNHLFYPFKLSDENTDLPLHSCQIDYKNDISYEENIKNALKLKKFHKDVDFNQLCNKCEKIIFTQSEMKWADIKRRAAENPQWPWYPKNTLDQLKDEMIKKGKWKEEKNGYINKNVELPKTSVVILEHDENGKIILEVKPQYGDTIHYEIDHNKIATINSPILKNPKFPINTLKASFLCVDSTNIHQTGDPYIWTAKLKINYKKYIENNKLYVELIPNPKINDIVIKYTLDGSNPENGLTYNDKIEVPDNCNIILAIAKYYDITSEKLSLKVSDLITNKINLDPNKKVKLNKTITCNSIQDYYNEIDYLSQYKPIIENVRIIFSIKDKSSSIIELIGEKLTFNTEQIKSLIDNIKNSLPNVECNINIEFKNITFENSEKFKQYANIKRLQYDENDIEQL